MFTEESHDHLASAASLPCDTAVLADWQIDLASGTALTFITNKRTVKCSQEEIERKKHEALARRRMRTEASLQNGAPM
ncbi:hypothetical protein EOD39_7947 [Acipenser ruthenus]|uniref:Uncharacterized protein n=1 Tax=Acipenser ruthenus TaxID=7906 RepID=A0A444U5B2_ACIRT|nr:hypothetical protein EOD39_7947 [Acipenser ruthenus]